MNQSTKTKLVYFFLFSFLSFSLFFFVVFFGRIYSSVLCILIRNQLLLKKFTLNLFLFYFVWLVGWFLSSNTNNDRCVVWWLLQLEVVIELIKLCGNTIWSCLWIVKFGCKVLKKKKFFFPPVWRHFKSPKRGTREKRKICLVVVVSC